jgi:hypothetical protein
VLRIFAQHWPCLLELDLAANALGTYGGRALGSALEHLPCLSVLKLAANALTLAVLDPLVAPALTHLDPYDNEVGKGCAKRLATAGSLWPAMQLEQAFPLAAVYS